jgi:hypothetical protein
MWVELVRLAALLALLIAAAIGWLAEAGILR